MATLRNAEASSKGAWDAETKDTDGEAVATLVFASVCCLRGRKCGREAVPQSVGWTRCDPQAPNHDW